MNLKHLIISGLAIAVSLPCLAGIHVRNLWPSNEVTVCFAEGEKVVRRDGPITLKPRNWSARNKNRIRQWVNEEYTSERTGIHFTGWLDCEESPEAEVVIFYNKNSVILSALFGGIHGLAGEFGPLRPGLIEGYPMALNSVTISKSGMDKGTAIHEFGHVAGLAHEHNHPEADKYGEKCIEVDPFYNYKFRYEPYDPESIMSYCSVNNKRLSQGDMALLKKLYP